MFLPDSERMQSLFNKANDELLKDIKETSGRMLSFKLEGLPPLDFPGETTSSTTAQRASAQRRGGAPSVVRAPRTSMNIPKKNRHSMLPVKCNRSRDYSLSMPVHDPRNSRDYSLSMPLHDPPSDRQFSLSMPLADIDATMPPRRKSARLFYSAIEKVQEQLNKSSGNNQDR